MIHLVMIACLISDPTDCERVVPPVMDAMSMTECNVISPMVVADYDENHRLRWIKRWWCEDGQGT